ncbi:MAG: glycosyltransferase family 39 protein [Pseudomonadota bacterium]
MASVIAAAAPHRERNPGGYVRDALWLSALALLIRVVLVLWAKDRFPPADDGSFYHVVAQRIALGAGYTWLWPDGSVTYAAHYPVGYPALLGLVYALFGARPVAAMGANAVLGALAVFAAQRALVLCGTRRQALLGGLLLALHPGLVGYTPALMTEGVSAELLVIVAWLTLRAGAGRGLGARLILVGACAGALTLVRPQLVVLAPVFGFFSLSSGAACYRERLLRALLVGGVAVSMCLPWTLRNCARMDRCVFVSANGGWNLLIGSLSEAKGAWAPIEGSTVPSECRTVFAEAEKDRCFGHAGLARIRANWAGFLALVPRKLAMTFDYFGAPGHYLHTSNARAFGDRAKLWLGIVETVWERLVLLVAILQSARLGTRRRPGSLMAALPAALFALLHSGYVAYLGFVLSALLSGKRLLKRPLLALSASAVLATALTHALFFGAGRYGFVCAGLLCLAAAGGGAPGGKGEGHGGEVPAQ